jgi:hypothetical protein
MGASAPAPEPTPRPGSITIPLTEPFILAGAEVKSVTMRRPKAGDFRRAYTKAAAEKLSNQQIMLNMAADLCSLAPEEFDELGMADMSTIIEKVEDFG